MALFYDRGPFGDATQQDLKKRLGFGKHDEVYFKMKLAGSTEKPVSVTDRESFEEFQALLAKRSTLELQDAGMVEVKMLRDIKVRNLMDKDESAVSANGKRRDVQLLKALNEQLGKKKGARGVGGAWDAECRSAMPSWRGAAQVSQGVPRGARQHREGLW